MCAHDHFPMLYIPSPPLPPTPYSELRELCLSFYDVRAVVVEVVSRAVAMNTADRQPVWARQMAALEGLQIYAPLGHALGLGVVSCELEDKCFQVLFPQTYEQTAAWLRQERLVNSDVLQRCSAQLQGALDEDGVLRGLVDHVQVHWYVLVCGVYILCGMSVASCLGSVFMQHILYVHRPYSMCMPPSSHLFIPSHFFPLISSSPLISSLSPGVPNPSTAPCASC